MDMGRYLVESVVLEGRSYRDVRGLTRFEIACARTPAIATAIRLKKC